MNKSRLAAYAGARDALQQVLAVLPEAAASDTDTVSVRLGLGKAAQAMGDLDAAEALYAQVLAVRPGHEDALMAQIDVTLARGYNTAALRQCEKARDRRPKNMGLQRRHAQILQNLNRFEDARDILVPLHAAQPDHVPTTVSLAATHRKLGDLDAADALYAGILAGLPGHEGALTGQIDTALARRDHPAALGLSELACTRRPKSLVLQRKQAQVLQAMDRWDEAWAILSALHDAQPTHIPTAIALANTERGRGNPEAADALYCKVLEISADHDIAQMGRIDLAMGRGDHDAGLDLCQQALARQPDKMGLLRKQAQILLATGRRHEARDILAALHDRYPNYGPVLITLANTERDRGDLEAADALYAKALELDGANWTALRARAALAEARGDVPGAIALLHGTAASVQDVLQDAAVEPERVLALLGLYLTAGRTEDAGAALTWLAGSLDVLSNAQLRKILQVSDASDHADLVASVITQVCGRSDINVFLARAVLNLAHVSEDAALTEQVEQALSERMDPAARLSFQIEAARMSKGPYEALRRALGTRQPQRGIRAAIELAELLIDCGYKRLALRYLRLLHRRAPNALAVMSLLIDAFVQAGRPEEGLAWLQAHPRVHEVREIADLRKKLLMALGRLDDLVLLIRTEIAEGRRRPGDVTLLQILCAQGHLEEAEHVAQALNADQVETMKKRAHFGTTFHGSRLNELRIYRMARQHALDTAPDLELVESYLHAADEVVNAWVRTPALPAAGVQVAPTPRTIFQYWDSPECPANVDALMQSWRGVPGWDYTRFDKPQAVAWLHDTYGKDYARAFRMARHVTEESDFLRLCVLHAQGGLYADADDVLTAHPDDILAEGSGLIVFREPFGVLANNVICAPPAHPAIFRAMTLAAAALLRRDNDGPWAKTGPGLMTRAVASHILVNPGQAACDTTILPLYHLRRHVHLHVKLPYKTTPSYWSGGIAKPSDNVMHALQAFAQAAVP